MTPATLAVVDAAGGPLVTPDQLDLVKKTIAKDATPDELKLYLYDCARQGVHPLDKLVHFTKRSGKYTPITSIDFMRIRAAETNEYAGSDDAVFSPSLMGSGDTHPLGATVTVWRLVQGTRCGFTASARWAEYKPDQNDFMWKKMPHTMLAKCAEALALRKGFPKQLAGLYAKEEMEQAVGGERPTTSKVAPLALIKPDGFDDWLLGLRAVADTGAEALKATWEVSSKVARKYLTDTEPETWASIKARAVHIDDEKAKQAKGRAK